MSRNNAHVSSAPSSSASAATASKREAHDNALREAKQRIRDLVRNDWAYDPPATLFPSTSLGRQRTQSSSYSSKDKNVAATTGTSSTMGNGKASAQTPSTHDGGGPSTVLPARENLPFPESNMMNDISEETQQPRQLPQPEPEREQEQELVTAKDVRKQLQMLKIQYSSSATMAPSKCLGLETGAKVLKWRLREYASSDSEMDVEDVGTSASAGPSSRRKSKSKESNKRNSKQYSENEIRHDDHEDVTAALDERARLRERRHRRRMKLMEEMAINPGLRFWAERRDAWTGAKKKAAIRAELRKERQLNRERSATTTTSDENHAAATTSVDTNIGEDDTHGAQDHQNHLQRKQSLRSSDDYDKSAHSSSSSSIPSPSELFPTQSALARGDNEDVGHDSGTEHQPGDPLLQMQADILPEEDSYDSDESLVPLVEPLLPENNLIRASITPAVYPSIYTKVIVQGLTPTIPINLADVVKATVEGWKLDGQWPPKPTQPPPTAPVGDFFTRRRAFSRASAVFSKDPHTNTKESHDAQSQNQPEIKKKTNNVSGNQASQPPAPSTNIATSPPAATATATSNRRKSSGGHSHSSSGVVAGAVKKVLSGIQNHSFHLRKSSRGASTDGADTAPNTNTTVVNGGSPNSMTGNRQLVTEIPVVEDP